MLRKGVDQALGSVAEVNDSDNLVMFDLEGSAVIPGKSPEAAMIRRIMRKCKKMTTIHRRKNSFYIPLWVQPEAGNKVENGQSLFQGLGR